MLDVARVRRGATAAFVAAIAGAVALVAISLFLPVGQPFGTINDTALLVMIVALLPVMLAHYELGGVVPLWPARLSLAGASLAVVGWAIVQGAMIAGIVTFDYEHGATGAFTALSVLQALIGLWIAGASLLAGRWLPPLVRTLGVVAGVGTVVMAAGLLNSGVNDTLTYIGGMGYQVALPIWAYLLGRVFRERAQAGGGVGEAAPA